MTAGLPAMLGADERAALALRALYAAWGYRRWRVSGFEEYDLYVRNRDFLLSEGVLTFNDADGRLKALKPDVTLSIVRHAPAAAHGVQRLHYHERVFRASPAGGGFEEITQVGLECLGGVGLYETCEVALLAARSLGIMGGDSMLDIAHMGLVTPFLRACPAGAEAAQAVARCLAQKNPDGIRRAGADYAIGEAWLLRALALERLCGAPGRVLEGLARAFPEPAYRPALRELRQVADALDSRGLSGRYAFDFSVMNSAHYYDGIVLRGYVAGIPNRVLSGGRYDPLMRSLGRAGGAIGFAVYLDQLDGAAPAQPLATLRFADGDAPASVLARAEQLASAGGVTAVREGTHA